jgi:PIN domain nuclease of toxin-antitoxin system
MERGNSVFVSSASAWGTATKHRLGKLDSAAPLVRDSAGWLAPADFRQLPVSVAHAERAGSWPQPHRDPFDRMLAAQSVLESLPLIPKDEALVQFGAATLW